MPESFGREIKTRSKHDKAEKKKHKEIVQMVIQEVTVIPTKKENETNNNSNWLQHSFVINNFVFSLSLSLIGRSLSQIVSIEWDEMVSFQVIYYLSDSSHPYKLLAFTLMNWKVRSSSTSVKIKAHRFY